MVDILELPKKDIYVIADTHGDFGFFMKNIKDFDIKNCILFIAGDCGIGFYNEKYYQNLFESINNECIFRNIHLLMIRGNHDDPSYFNENKINFSNVKTLKDYTIVQTNDKNILCIGGGLSIDRSDRIYFFNKNVETKYEIELEFNKNISKEEIIKHTQKTYWKDELPIYNENLLSFINDLSFNIDYVITHTSPNFAFKSDKDGIEYWINKDENLLKDLEHERLNVTKIYDFLIKNNNIIKKWVYGHFHERNEDNINGTRFIALSNADYTFDYHILELNSYYFNNF